MELLSKPSFHIVASFFAHTVWISVTHKQPSPSFFHSHTFSLCWYILSFVPFVKEGVCHGVYRLAAGRRRCCSEWKLLTPPHCFQSFMDSWLSDGFPKSITHFVPRVHHRITTSPRSIPNVCSCNLHWLKAFLYPRSIYRIHVHSTL